MTVIYDIETLSNCFTYTAKDVKTGNVFQYTIWKDINEIVDLLKHLSECKGMIGFNNINFDYPVIHFIIIERHKLLNLNADEIAKRIYKKAQDTISKEFSAIREKEVVIPQLDLFRIWHYDNKARMTGLKKLEIALNFPNVQDMPYAHNEKIKTKEQIQEILDYNLNDVEATAVFYEKTKSKIELRKGLMKKYGLNCLNFPDSKIGEQLMLKLYCQYAEKEESEVRKLRTRRDNFKFAECIPDYIKFETPEFNQLLDYLKNIEVSELKESFKYSFEYNGFTFDLGTGGLHACVKAGVHLSDNQEVIIDCDVASLYPSLAITLDLYPQHLGSEFSTIYEDGIVKPRLKAKKEGDMVMSDGFKLSANSVYGKSNSEYSFLYDPLYTLKTTLAGQVALCMLSEMLMTRVPNLKMLQVNTDGITVKIPVEHKRLYWKICQEWEEKTKLGLEYIAYSQMIIRDVNNYIAVAEKSGKVKYKGTFKPNHEMIKDGEYHKSLSQGIVSLAVSDYFLKNIPVENTVKQCKDIYLFCKTFNATHGWTCETFDTHYEDVSYKEVVEKLITEGYVESFTEGFYVPKNGSNVSGVQLLKEGNKIKICDNIEQQQKTNRYYLSTSGKGFRKIKEERKIEVEANKKVIIFNKFFEVPFEEYDVDYQYYIDECYKIIHTVDGTLERLENEKREERERLKREKEEENFLKYCVNKIPTQRQFDLYKRDWLIDIYGVPEEIKPSKINKKV